MNKGLRLYNYNRRHVRPRFHQYSKPPFYSDKMPEVAFLLMKKMKKLEKNNIENSIFSTIYSKLKDDKVILLNKIEEGTNLPNNQILEEELAELDLSLSNFKKNLLDFSECYKFVTIEQLLKMNI